VLCCAVLCCAVLCCAVLCCAVLCCAVAVLSPSGRVCFLPPGCVVYQYDLGPYMMQNDLLAVPAGPGRSVAYTLGLSNSPQVTNGQILKTLFTNPKQLMPLLFRCAWRCMGPVGAAACGSMVVVSKRSRTACVLPAGQPCAACDIKGISFFCFVECLLWFVVSTGPASSGGRSTRSIWA